MELIHELFRRLGVELEIKLLPWKRVLKNVEVGRADGVNLLMRNAERERYLVFTDVVLRVKELFYYRIDRLETFEWNTFSDLRGRAIGLVSGYTYGEEFLKAVDGLRLNVDYSDSSLLAFRKLGAGRVDLVLENDTVANALMAQNPEWKVFLRAASKPVSAVELHLAFSRRSPAKALLPKVNSVIAEMKRDGTIERIINGSR